MLLVAVGALADREVAALALVALAADDREGDHDAVADLELLVVAADLDHLAHGLVAHDVARLHAGHEAVVEVQVRAADRAARHLDDGVAGVLDLRIGHRVVADVLFAVPAQRAHVRPPRRLPGQRRGSRRVPTPRGAVSGYRPCPRSGPSRPRACSSTKTCA